jgi:tetrahydromethanopterin S-methyltransferase subunit A
LWLNADKVGTKTARKRFDDLAGKVCEKVLPIKEKYFLGKGSKVAICCLASIDLLKEISNSVDIMDRIVIAARLLSENRGIDTLIQFAIYNPTLCHIILCGSEVKGHQAGQALLSLCENGIDTKGRIIGAKGPYPFLKSSQNDIDRFRHQVRVCNMIGETDLAKVRNSLLATV